MPTGDRVISKKELETLSRNLSRQIKAVRSHAVGGYKTFLDLEDTPDSFVGKAGQVVGVDDSEAILGFRSIGASPLDVLGTPTYSSIQDWLNLTQSAGKTTPDSPLSAHAPANGTLDVAAGTGFIKTTDSPIGATKFFNWDAINLALDDGVTSYIYVDYTAGSPVPKKTTTRADIEMNRHFTLGRAYRDGNTVHFVNSGTDLTNTARRDHERLVGVRGFERDSGGVISESGERFLESTAGVSWLGANEIVTAAQDTNNGDRFTKWYHVGGVWNSATGQQQVDNTQYDNGTNLVNLTANKYGTMWCYIDYDSHLVVVYGSQNGTLTQAQAADPPDVPPFIRDFAILAARIIVQQGTANIIEFKSAYEVFFPHTTPSEHNDMGSLQGGQADQYYHLTAAEYGALGGATAWTELTDTPAAIEAVKYVRGNAGGAALEFRTKVQVLADLSGNAGAAFDWNDQDLSKINSLMGKEIATPANPAAGYNKIYCKNDDSWYTLDSDGNEVELGAGGAATFLGLTDTPAGYSGRAGEILAVGCGEETVKFIRNIVIPKTALSDASQSGDINCHQGYTTDGTYHYGIDTAKLYKWNAAWVEQTTNADPFNGIDGDHMGDGDEYDGNLYIPGETWVSCDTFSNQKILVFATSDLSRSSANDISAQGHEAAGLAVVPCHGTAGVIYVVSYCDGSKIWKYKLSDFSYIGTISLSTTLTNLQGITYRNGYFYLSQNDGKLYVADTAGHVVLLLTDVTVGDHEGLDFSQDELRWLIDEGVLEKVHFFEVSRDWEDTVLMNEFGEIRGGSFLGRNDTPNDYSGETGKFCRVKATEDGLEFAVGGSGGGYGEEVIDENFDSLALGAIHGLGVYTGWAAWNTSTEDADCSAQIVANPGNGRMLRLADANIAGLVLTQLDANAGKEIVQCLFKCKMRISELGSTNNRGYINIYDKAAAHIGIYFKDNFLMWYTGSAGVNIQAAVVDTWYNVTVFMDCTGNKATIWVDDVLKLTKQTCSIGDIESIQVLTKSVSPAENYNFDIDDLLVVDLTRRAT